MEPESRTFGGRYELSSLIATGGMGQVWQGRDTVLNRDVAVKVLRSEYTGDPTFLRRFRAEAQLSAGLVHPHVATLFDYGEVGVGPGGGEHVAYLVMELVRGESLSALMARAGPLSAGRTLDILRQSAAGLAAAHEAGIVHRDVKPGNVLLGPGGQVKITDFGVAVSASSVPLTGTGQVIGTAHYLSPEQARGARATPASDVYALGLVAYECLAGHRAFEGESSVQVALKQIHESPLPLPDDVPEPVRRLVGRALAKDPVERFPDGAAVRDAVDAVLAGHPPGDVALPGRPPGGAVREAPTAVLPAVGAGAPGATARFPVAGAEPVTGSGRRRGRLLVPVLAVLALAAIVLGAFQVVGTAGSSSGAPPAPTSAPGTPSSVAPVVPLVTVDAADYVGRPVADVRAELIGRGLQVTLRPVPTGDVPGGQVTAVDPVGGLAPGSVVTVTHAVAPPATVAPAPTSNPDAEPSRGSDTGRDDGSSGHDKGGDNGGDNGHGNGRDHGSRHGHGDG